MRALLRPLIQLAISASSTRRSGEERRSFVELYDDDGGGGKAHSSRLSLFNLVVKLSVVHEAVGAPRQIIHREVSEREKPAPLLRTYK